jgi:hypothetical protein
MPDIRSLLRDAAVPPSGRPDLATIEGRATRRRRGRRLAGTALVALVAIMAVSLTLVVSDDPAERLDTVDAPGTPAVGSWSGLAGLLPASAWEGLTRFGGREAAATGLQVLGSENEEMGAVLGFGPTDFDYWVEGGNSPHEVTIGSGDFDVDAIEAAVRGDSDWSTQLEQKTHRGHPYYSWGDDYAIAGDPAPGRPLGRGGRLLATENLLVWTLGDQEMRAVIDRLVDGPLTPPRPAGQLLAMATADNEDLAGLSVVPARTSGRAARSWSRRCRLTATPGWWRGRSTSRSR